VESVVTEVEEVMKDQLTTTSILRRTLPTILTSSIIQAISSHRTSTNIHTSHITHTQVCLQVEAISSHRTTIHTSHITLPHTQARLQVRRELLHQVAKALHPPARSTITPNIPTAVLLCMSATLALLSLPKLQAQAAVLQRTQQQL